MSIFNPKKAASLLTILLLLAVVGAMVLAGTRALLEASRNATSVSQKEEARSIALTGIMEGLTYVAASESSSKTEYGTIVNWNLTGLPPVPYSNTPLRRGFAAGTAVPCSTQTAAEALSAASSAIDKNCPYYDLAVRNRGGYDATSYTKFSLNSRDFPSTTIKILPFKGTSLSLTVAQGTGVSSVQFRMCDSAVNCIYQQQNIAPGGVYNPIINSTYTHIYVTVNYTTYPATPTAIVTMNSPAQQVMIGKAHTTVDVTGYSGEAKVKMVYTIRNNAKFLSEVVGGFNNAGIQQ